MLASLTIKNVVLIDHLTIDFKTGLCALTGETGAGKSILLDSLGLALGARSDAGLVRKGEEQASVTAMFDIPTTHPVLSLLKEQDLEGDTTLILRRSVSSEGGSKAFINDQAVSATLLKQVGEMLVEIHGQFDTQSLLNAKFHRGLLDEYANHEGLSQDVEASWKTWKASVDHFKKIQSDIEQARRDEDYFRTSLEDLDILNPKEGEEESLTTLRSRLLQRDKITESISAAETGLQEIEVLLSTVWRALGRIGDEAKEAVQAMDRGNAEIQEAVNALNAMSMEFQNSEYSLEEIDDRLFSLKAQARKHNCSIDDLPKKRNEIAAALDAIEHQDNVLADLYKKTETNKKAFQEHARKLSESRQKASKKLSDLVMKELPPLKLDKARFEVGVEIPPEEQWNANGMDNVQFLVATNPGSAAGPLNKIASGGEMARFMLALKVVLSEVGVAGTLVFDEVDSGIGGATAAAVGERLARLAKNNRQILVVTHSPQVAAMAAHHWIVAKGGKESVKTNIVPLFEAGQRQEEIARMLSGASITAEARAAAGKLLEASAA